MRPSAEIVPFRPVSSRRRRPLPALAHADLMRVIDDLTVIAPQRPELMKLIASMIHRLAAPLRRTNIG